jgi:hypothetical protein
MLARVHIFAASTSIALIASTSAFPQNQFLMPDRTSDAIFRIRDLNNNGIIEEPDESFLWFNAANLAGTVGPLNPTALAVSVCRVAIMGDQQNFLVYRIEDANDDGDAQDLGESNVLCGPGNSAALSFAFPTGAAFNNICQAFITNAGNASGPDAIYILEDLNGDNDAMDFVDGVHEARPYVGEPVFGPGNGPYSPQEILFDQYNVGYLRNSGTLNGVFRFEDIGGNGRADDAGEFTVFFDGTNASGVAISAGFAIAHDPLRPNAFYLLQTATGGVDQLIRIQDKNGNKNAQDKGEAQLVWTYATTGFTNVDMTALANGDVLVTDNSGITVARLHDATKNGDFLDAGEQTTYYAAGGTVLQARQIDPLCAIGDVTCNGLVDVDDLLQVINNWGAAPGCKPADITCNGMVDVDDLLAVINHWGT